MYEKRTSENRCANQQIDQDPFKNGYDCPILCVESDIKNENGINPIMSGYSWLEQNQLRHGRAILTSEEACDIFQCRPQQSSRDRNRATVLAQKYGVSVKTVRDIWVGRTWYRATYLLDKDQPVQEERLLKRAGRPLGAKDRKPRLKKESRPPSIAQNDCLDSLLSDCSKKTASIYEHPTVEESRVHTSPLDAAHVPDHDGATDMFSFCDACLTCPFDHCPGFEDFQLAPMIFPSM
jgi:hypothetical protein